MSLADKSWTDLRQGSELARRVAERSSEILASNSGKLPPVVARAQAQRPRMRPAKDQFESPVVSARLRAQSQMLGSAPRIASQVSTFEKPASPAAEAPASPATGSPSKKPELRISFNAPDLLERVMDFVHGKGANSEAPQTPKPSHSAHASQPTATRQPRVDQFQRPAAQPHARAHAPAHFGRRAKPLESASDSVSVDPEYLTSVLQEETTQIKRRPLESRPAGGLRPAVLRAAAAFRNALGVAPDPSAA